MDISVVPYNDLYEKEWDTFVDDLACNSSFLQSRRFLNYHPSDRFIDDSLLFYSGNELIGVCPGAVSYENNNKIYVSHPGSTYGGLIVSKNILRAEKILALIDEFETYLRKNNYISCILKQNNPLMNTCPMDLLDFCLYYKGYKEYRELDICIDFSNYNVENIISNFSKLKKRQVRKCIDSGLVLREMSGEKDMERFLDILAANLKKFNKSPYHTVDDLLELKERFPKTIQYWGAEIEGKIIAESMVFLFDRSNVAHTHYLAADPEYSASSPMSYIYYSMIDMYSKLGYRHLSWGITTEHLGVELNFGLTNNKEEFGGTHNVVSIYEKKLT